MVLRFGHGSGSAELPVPSFAKEGTGDVALDGMNVLALGYFEGNVWAGETQASMAIVFDERADERQRHALQSIFGGQAGG
jgi:hypothetical protein